MVILFMYGNAQLGLFIHDVLSLARNERVAECIHIHGFIATLHIICINFFWRFLKGHEYPPNPQDTGMRPGNYMWYMESGLYFLFLIVQLMSDRDPNNPNPNSMQKQHQQSSNSDAFDNSSSSSSSAASATTGIVASTRSSSARERKSKKID